MLVVLLLYSSNILPYVVPGTWYILLSGFAICAAWNQPCFEYRRGKLMYRTTVVLIYMCFGDIDQINH